MPFKMAFCPGAFNEPEHDVDVGNVGHVMDDTLILAKQRRWQYRQRRIFATGDPYFPLKS